MDGSSVRLLTWIPFASVRVIIVLLVLSFVVIPFERSQSTIDVLRGFEVSRRQSIWTSNKEEIGERKGKIYCSIRWRNWTSSTFREWLGLVLLLSDVFRFSLIERETEMRGERRERWIYRSWMTRRLLMSSNGWSHDDCPVWKLK